MSFCTRCGRARGGPARFCTSCGAPFAGATEHAPVTETAPPGVATPAAETAPAIAPAAGTPQTMPPAGPPQYADDPFATLFGPREPPPSAPAPPAHAGDYGYYPEPPRPRRTRTIAIGAAVLAVLAGGGVAAWALTRPASHSSAHAARTPRVHVSTTPTGTATRPASSPPAAPSPARARLVKVAPGISAQRDEPSVVAFLTSYFTAINTYDYQQYRRLLDAAVQRQETAVSFAAGYRGTRDSAITLTGLASSGAQVAASVSFTSHQPAANSPSHSKCTRWNITLFLTPKHGSYVKGTAPPGYQAVYRAC